MEKTSNDFINLLNLPTEIQQEIAAYLDGPSLGFFARSNKQLLKNVLPLLRHYQVMFPLQLTAKGDSTYLYQANQLLVCGYNGYGQLGLGDKKNRSAFTTLPWSENQGWIEQVIAGGNHTIVLTQDNRLWWCGHNDQGQLGLGDQAQRSTFTAVPWPAERGRIEQVIVGGDYTVVLTDANTLWVCGHNRYGQLGLGDQAHRSTFTAVPWPEEQDQIQQVIAGELHTVVLTQDNRLLVCGNNGFGQLGLGDQAQRSTFTAVPWPEERGRIQQVIAGEHHTVVLTEGNRLWVCGNNGFGQLGLGDQAHRSTFTVVPWPEEQGRIQQVIAGGMHTIVLMKDNRLWGCGVIGSSQLGLGDDELPSSFTALPWSEERGQIQQVIAGSCHTVLLTQDNRLWMCGNNLNGQLGLRDKTHHATFTLVENLHVFKFNQLIKLGTSLTQTSGTETDTFYNQHQLDESEGQLPLKKMRL